MDPIIPILFILSAVASGLAWLIARQRRPYLPVALLLTFALVSEAVREALRELVFIPYYPKLAGAPAHGWLRVAAHLEQALFIAWAFGITALAVWAFAQRRPWAVLGAYLFTVAAVLLGYPVVRGRLLRQVYLGVEMATLCIAIGCLVLWARKRERWGLQHLVTGTIIVAEVVMLPGPFRGNIFQDWDRAWAVLLVEYLAIIVVQGVAWHGAFTRG